MQNELIHALSIVRPHMRDKERMARLIRVIKTLDVPPTDYEKVARYIFLILDQYPEIFKAAPHDKPLKDLCLYCINHIAMQEALETRGPSPRQ